MSDTLSAEALVEMVAARLCGQHWQAPCAGCDGECRFVGQARAALAAVAKAAGLHREGFRNVALLLDGERIAPGLAALLRALAEVSDA